MVDLHSHSTFSDGSFTPTELVEHAVEIGLEAIALTDHNTINGLDEFNEAGKKLKMETISGIELSTETHNEEFHIVGLFIDKKQYSVLQDFVKITVERKIESNKLLVNNLAKKGYDISYDEIVEKYGSEQFNRVEIAKTLVEKGYASSINEAFDGLISKKSGNYIPAKRPNTFETISFLKSIGAVPIWAHPLKDTTVEKLDEVYLPLAKEAGLAAIEVMHCSYSNEQKKNAMALAEKHSLIASGGSDFHGVNKVNVLLGTGTNNNVSVDYKVLEKLKKLSSN